jgi:hypothetical protein
MGKKLMIKSIPPALKCQNRRKKFYPALFFILLFSVISAMSSSCKTCKCPAYTYFGTPSNTPGAAPGS